MVARVCIWLLAAASLVWPAVPSPREHFGFTPGDDRKLAGYAEMVAYFRKLEASSGRLRLVEFGRTSLGKPMYLAIISAPENLRQLDRYRRISRRLALGQPAPEEARRLAAAGKVVV